MKRNLKKEDKDFLKDNWQPDAKKLLNPFNIVKIQKMIMAFPPKDREMVLKDPKKLTFDDLSEDAQAQYMEVMKKIYKK